jgi:hypothetical protein
MRKFSLILFLLASASTAVCRAQSPADESLPPGPLVNSSMPDRSRWTVDIVYTDRPKSGQPTSAMEAFQKAAQSDPVLAKQMANPQFAFALRNLRPVHILVSKTGKIRHEERDLEEGAKGELWRFGDDEVERLPNAPSLSARNVAGLVGTDFPELDWISKQTFVGIQTNTNRKCLAYRMDVYSVDDHALQGTRIAFVDFATRNPVSYQFQEETRTYTILAPPESTLTVPDDFKEAARQLESRLQRATPHLGTP